MRAITLDLVSIVLMLGAIQAQEVTTQRRVMPPGGTPVTLMMDWDVYRPSPGVGVVFLHVPCQNSMKESNCQCNSSFGAIRSQEFVDYISSFGDSKVPVVYQVWYGADGQAQTALLVSAGSWSKDSFPPNDGLLGVGIKGIKATKPGQVAHSHTTHNPADCFLPLKK